jgi:hypothetical protein
MASRTIAGTAAELQQRFGEYAEAGFDEFIVPDFNLGRTMDERRDGLERIKADVLDRL